MKKLCLALLFCLLCKNSYAMVFSFLKVDCYPELDIFEVRLLEFDWIPDKGTFYDKAVTLGSSEYKFLKNKYSIIEEYHAYRNEPLDMSGNSMIKECVIGEDKYTIHINRLGTTISKGEEVLAKELFFSSAWNDWNIWQLVYNAKQEEFLVLGEFSFDLPVLRFAFSTKGGKVLDESVIKEKAKVFEQEVLRDDGLWRRGPAFGPLIIDYNERKS